MSRKEVKHMFWAVILMAIPFTSAAHNKVVVIPLDSSNSIDVSVQGTTVPKTGHTISTQTGDDGDLQKGAPWPNPRFIKPGDGTVVDALTGLTWLQNPHCYSDTSAPSAITWTAAMNAVVELNTSGTMNSNDCGDVSNNGAHQTDWRLPNVREQHSLIHFRILFPAVPDTTGVNRWTMDEPFSSDPGGRSWTSSGTPLNAALKWYVDISRGDLNNYDKDQPWADVWPVRGGDLP